MIRKHIGEYLKTGAYPFHMPGHKRNAEFLPRDAFKYDLTEIPGMDNLYDATGFLRDFQAKIARIYGADNAAFLVNGATGGIMAAVMAVCGDGDILVAGRNSHRSVYGAMAASGASPVYVYPETTGDGLIGALNPKEVRVALDANPQCRVVIITSPTYEGYVSDIPAIARTAHERGALLIVDEAHGAHFPFHEAFPSSAIASGADIAVVSFHKTLPCPSQCAALLWNNARADSGLLRRYLALTQTSSPSYALMAMADDMLERLEESTELFDKYTDNLIHTRARLETLRNLRLLRDGGRIIDIGKVVILTSGHMSGEELYCDLAERGVQAEAYGKGHVLAMTSPADRLEGFERLAAALADIDGMVERRGTGEAFALGGVGLPVAEVRYSPRKALRMPKRAVKLSESGGRAAAEFVAPYPPGIPVLAPGEIIDLTALGGYLDGRDMIEVIIDWQ